VDHEIGKIADRQQINITRAQLIELGLYDEAIRRRVKKGSLYLVHRAVYSVGRPARLGPERASAAVLSCGDGAALADEAGAALWGFRNWPYPPYVVFVPKERRQKGIVTRSVKLHPKDIRRHQGIRVVSPARIILDFAARLPDNQLKRAIDEARLSRTIRLTLGQLEDVIDRYPQHPGAQRLAWIIGRAQQEPDRSGYETGFDDFCEERGFPRPLGNRVMFGVRVDRFFEDEGVAVELDGWVTHSDALAAETKSEREAILLEHGIPTLTITRRRFERDPDREERRLRAILEQQRRRNKAA
jgi:hypothetical protein